MNHRLLTLLVTSIGLLLLTAASALAAPVILKEGIAKLGAESVTLTAEIDPAGKETTYHFEYGLAECSLNPCTATPQGKFPKGAVVSVEATLEGLTPATTYHFRVIAENSEGEVKGPGRTFTTFASDPDFGPCPNDFLRLENPMAPLIEHSSAGLPDCRAYEQATPTDKNGLNAKGRVAWVKASSEGDAVSFITPGGIEGGDGAQEEPPPSLARKGPGGWATEGMLPPATAGEEAFALAWTPSFSHVFSFARKLDLPRVATVLSRSSDGSFEEVVPYDPALEAFPAVADSTADGSVVIFESPAELLPGAIAGKSNLYVWERASKALRLAGVFNDGSPPPQGAFAGPYDWGEGESDLALSKGGSAEYYYTQDTNTLAADGSAAYFTAAGTGEIYVRLNPTEPQSPLAAGECTDPELACTVQVSATQRTDPDLAGERPAAFLGAAVDGQSVLFASAEKLTDDANTGPEPEASIAQAPLDDGDPKNLDCLPAKAAGLSIEGEHIYWADPEENAIGRAKVGECELDDPEDEFIAVPPVEVESEPGVFELVDAKPQYVVVDGEEVWWTNAVDGKDGNGTIGHAELGLGGPEEVDSEWITGAHNPRGIAVDATHVYWANAGDEIPTRTIGQATREGTEADQAFIQVDSGLGELKPQGIAVSATHIYAAIEGTEKTSFVFRYDLPSGTNRKVLFEKQNAKLRGIATDATSVYWAREGFEAIGRMKLDLSEPELEWIKEAGRPHGLALDTPGEIYWSANQGTPPNPGNDLYRYELASGDLTALAVDATSPNGTDVQGILGTSADGSRVYFAANGIPTGTIGSPNGRGEIAEAGDCAGGFGKTSTSYSGECNLYLAEEGAPTRFIVRLDADGDAGNWTPRGGAGDQLEKTARVTPDGSTLLFRSQRRLSDYDNEGVSHLYRWRIGDTAPGCLSCNPTGQAPVGAPTLASIDLSVVVPPEPSFVLSRNLSADGNRVFFESTDALVGADVNGAGGCPTLPGARFPVCRDVYEWEAQGTGSCEEEIQAGGCLYLLSSGRSPEASFFADASVSGDDAFLITSSRLVGQDQDRLYDVYAASVGGGLLSQNERPKDPCPSLEGCQGGLDGAPAFETPATTSVAPAEVVKAKPRRCPKGKSRVRAKGGKTRCVPKRSKRNRGKAKSRNRAAQTTGRASR